MLHNSIKNIIIDFFNFIVSRSSYGRWNSGSFTTPSVSTLVIFFLIATYQHFKF